MAQVRTLHILTVPVTVLVLGLGIIFASAYIRIITVLLRGKYPCTLWFQHSCVSAYVPGKCPPPFLSIPAKRPPVLVYFGCAALCERAISMETTCKGQYGPGLGYIRQLSRDCGEFFCHYFIIKTVKCAYELHKESGGWFMSAKEQRNNN